MSESAFYAESFAQLASISAVLGGLAFAAAAAVLSAAAAGPQRLDRSATVTVGAAVASAAGLVVSALAWSLLRLEAMRPSASGTELGAEFLELNKFAAHVFIAGLVALFVAIGASGWMGSRTLGVFTTVVGVVAGVASLVVVFRFVN